MTTFGIRALVVAMVLVAQGCNTIFKRGGRPELLDGRYGPDTRPADNRSLADGFGLKSVEGKQPPSRLLAHDGTSCIVPKKQFDQTVLGTSVWCIWTDTDR